MAKFSDIMLSKSIGIQKNFKGWPNLAEFNEGRTYGLSGFRGLVRGMFGSFGLHHGKINLIQY